MALKKTLMFPNVTQWQYSYKMIHYKSLSVKCGSASFEASSYSQYVAKGQ